MRRELLATFGPDRDGLLQKVSELVDDQMLVEIAKADYGQDVPEHLSELRQIRDAAAVPDDLMGRVLSLLFAGATRPADTDTRSGR